MWKFSGVCVSEVCVCVCARACVCVRERGAVLCRGQESNQVG